MKGKLVPSNPTNSHLQLDALICHTTPSTNIFEIAYINSAVWNTKVHGYYFTRCFPNCEGYYTLQPGKGYVRSHGSANSSTYTDIYDWYVIGWVYA